MKAQDTETRLSADTVVVWREMNGYESMLADGFAAKLAKRNDEKFPDGSTTAKTYAIGAVRSINGTTVNPLAKYAQFMDVAQQLSLEEMTALLTVVFPEDAKDEPGAAPGTGAAEELKNE